MFIPLLTVTSGTNTIVTAPTNTAAKVGTPAIFNCTVNCAEECYVFWKYQTSKSETRVQIYTSRESDVKSDLQDKFGIERNVTNGKHNLVIKNVQTDLAAQYVCGFAFDGAEEVAFLVAVSMCSVSWLFLLGCQYQCK